MQLTKSLASLVRPGNQIKAAMRYFFYSIRKDTDTFIQYGLQVFTANC